MMVMPNSRKINEKWQFDELRTAFGRIAVSLDSKNKFLGTFILTLVVYNVSGERFLAKLLPETAYVGCLHWVNQR